jgi:hypothetical protein
VTEDSGAEETWISPYELERIGRKKGPLSKPGVKYSSASGDEFEAQGEIELQITGKMPHSLIIPCLVLPDNSPVHGLLVGRDFINIHGHFDRNELFSTERGTKSHLVLVTKKESVGLWPSGTSA